jgi:hypothetical protein
VTFPARQFAVKRRVAFVGPEIDVIRSLTPNTRSARDRELNLTFFGGQRRALRRVPLFRASI